jgi:hypothetical protein
MHGFGVALVGVGGGRDAQVLAIPEGFGEVPLELAAVIGLLDQIAQADVVAIQMLLVARGEDGAGRRAAESGAAICGRWAQWWRTGAQWA